MNSENVGIVVKIAAVVWVGGWGFLMFRYPEFFAEFCARLGASMFTSPKNIAVIRRVGFLEMALTGLAVIGEIVRFALGSKWL